VWPGGVCQQKIPVTPPGMVPATFRLVAQCLNQMRHRVPKITSQESETSIEADCINEFCLENLFTSSVNSYFEDVIRRVVLTFL
jgi:hypothetical protein